MSDENKKSSEGAIVYIISTMTAGLKFLLMDKTEVEGRPARIAEHFTVRGGANTSNRITGQMQKYVVTECPQSVFEGWLKKDPAFIRRVSMHLIVVVEKFDQVEDAYKSEMLTDDGHSAHTAIKLARNADNVKEKMLTFEAGQ